MPNAREPVDRWRAPIARVDVAQLRVKDIDCDEGLVFVRGGKGDKDRSTLLAEVGREELRAQLRRSEALHRADRRRVQPDVGVRSRLGV